MGCAVSVAAPPAPDPGAMCAPCTPPKKGRQLNRRSSIDGRSPLLSPPPQPDLDRVARTIWVASSPGGGDELRRSTSAQLKPLFSAYGNVTNITINRYEEDEVDGADPSGASTGWALVTFADAKAAQEAVAAPSAPTLGGQALEVTHAEVDRVMSSALAGTMASMQFGVAFGIRRGHCSMHAGCEAYRSGVTARNDKGGGRCQDCGCYPALHVNLGKYPTRCNHTGCGCPEFYSDPSETSGDPRLESSLNWADGATAGGADNAGRCGQCGHAESTHTSSSAAWQVSWQDIQLQGRIGTGHNGDIHRCVLWDKVFAVKVLKQDRGGFAAADFLREITLLVELRHPHISELVAACCPMAMGDEAHMAIVSEFAENGDLHAILRRGKRHRRKLANSQWLQFGLEVARGMNYLHTRSPPVYHGGLKPSKCLIDKHLQLRVSDFGGSFGADDRDGGAMGYMAPENVRASATATGSGHELPTTVPSAAADVWSMGMILWGLRARAPPWEDTKPFEVASRILCARAHRPLPLPGGNRRWHVSESTKAIVASGSGSNGNHIALDLGTLNLTPATVSRDSRDSVGSSVDDTEDPLIDRALCDLMCRCWHPVPSERPSFLEIMNALEILVIRSEKTSDVRDAAEAANTPRGILSRKKLHKFSSRDMVVLGTSADGEDVHGSGRSMEPGIGISPTSPETPDARVARLQGVPEPGSRRRERFLSGVGGRKARVRRASLYVSTECRVIDVETEILVGECVGDGGFGKVFRGSWQGTPVAVKRLHTQDLNAEVLDAMKGEIGVMTRMHHPNIVMLMGMCTAPPWISVVTEFLGRPGRTLDGGTLHIATVYQLLHNTPTPITNRHIKSFSLDVARGMSYLHNCLPPIIHRDLKTANLLLTRSLQVKIADFGTASTRQALQKVLPRKAGQTAEEIMANSNDDDNSEEEEEEEEEDLAMTMAYAAPEVLENGHGGPPCDVFSFGVVLWELFTRQRPWDGIHPIKVSYMVLQEGARLEIPSNVPQLVAAGLIGDCWKVDPSERPSFPELLQRVDGAIKVDGAATPGVGMTPGSVRSPETPVAHR